MPGFVAFLNKIAQTFAVVFIEIADNGQFHPVIRKFLKNFSGHSGTQFEKIRQEVLFANDDGSGFLVTGISQKVNDVVNIFEYTGLAFDLCSFPFVVFYEC
jgi:hypothetical protein